MREALAIDGHDLSDHPGHRHALGDLVVALKFLDVLVDVLQLLDGSVLRHLRGHLVGVERFGRILVLHLLNHDPEEIIFSESLLDLARLLGFRADTWPGTAS